MVHWADLPATKRREGNLGLPVQVTWSGASSDGGEGLRQRLSPRSSLAHAIKRQTCADHAQTLYAMSTPAAKTITGFGHSPSSIV